MKKLVTFKKAFWALAMTAAVFSAVAQESSSKKTDTFLSDYVTRNWTSADGLPGMSITDIIQDSMGYIYIGTYEGLVRFDGVEFVTFGRNYDPKYDFVSVRAIYQDRVGNLWVGHNDEGVSCISSTGEVTRYTSDIGLPNNSVRALCEDNNGNIWIGTANGVCFLNERRDVVHPAGLAALGEDTLQVSQMYCDTAGRVWVTSDKENGLFVYTNNKFERYTGITSVENPRVKVVTQDNTGAFWFGVSPYYAVRIKGTEETVYDLSHGRSIGTVFNSIYQDSNANIWFGLDSGVTILHEGKLTFFDKSNGLPDDKITKIIEDREGNIWFSSDRGGIGRLSRSKFRTMELDTSVNAICEDTIRGVKWIATDDGVFCYRDDHYEENELTELCKGIRTRHVEMTKDGELLVSTYINLGQLCLMPDNTIKQWTKDTGLTGNKCRVAIKASSGDIYVGTTEGLNVINGKTGEIRQITKADGIKNEYIMCIYEDYAGRIWVGTDGGGIFLIEDGKITDSYTTDTGLCGNVVFKVTEIQEGEIWVTTGAGISRYDPVERNFSNLNSSNGLGTDGIFQMMCDYTETVWMTSNRGISAVKLSELEAVADGTKTSVTSRFFGKSEGLVSGGVTSTSLASTDSYGRLWFPLIDGFAMYDPVKAGKNSIVQQPYIQEFTIDTEKFDYRGEPIVLSPSSKRLSLKYTGLTFTSAEQMQFSYRLEGFEDDYSAWTPLRTVSYTNLKPGTYYFTVRAQNSDEVLSDVSHVITIIKKPYPWQNFFFWMMVTLGVLVAISLGVDLKIRSMRKNQLELKQKVLERTQELSKEKYKSESLLLNILPAGIAKELTDSPNHIIARQYPKATVLFTDIVGFTNLSDSMTAEQIVTILNNLTVKFDERARIQGVEKIKTMGDSYMAATGLTNDQENDGAIRMIEFAKGLLQDVRDFNRENGMNMEVRIGINTGNLVAGVIGKSKFNYDVWGDTVNVASRMESSGEPMKIHITESTYQEIKDICTPTESRIAEIKGKGKMKCYFI